MRIYLVRHGETQSNKEGLVQGHFDSKLTEKGIEQAQKIGMRLKDESFDLVYSSDLQRAKNTALEILKFHSNKLIIDERLRERNYGVNTGKKKKNLDKKFLGEEGFTSTPLNGENFFGLIERIKDFCEKLPLDKNILIVSHHGPTRALLHIFLSKTMEETMRNSKPQNSALYILEKKGDTYELVLENCIKHLD